MLPLSCRDANSVDVGGALETESSNGKDTLVSISFGCMRDKIVFKFLNESEIQLGQLT